MSDSFSVRSCETIGVSRIFCSLSNAPSRRMKISGPRVSTEPAGVSAFWPLGGRNPAVRQLHVDALGLLADDIDLLHARHMQQPLAQRFRIAHQQALRFAL